MLLRGVVDRILGRQRPASLLYLHSAFQREIAGARRFGGITGDLDRDRQWILGFDDCRRRQADGRCRALLGWRANGQQGDEPQSSGDC